MAEPRRLTEGEWRRVFSARCRSKQGHPLTPEEQSLVEAAFRSDRERYTAMEPEVFDATVPYGSSTRWKGDANG